VAQQVIQVRQVMPVIMVQVVQAAQQVIQVQQVIRVIMAQAA
jgi:hypothetical protein